MKTPQISRITFVDGKIKGFDGRTKLDEIDLSALETDSYKSAVNQTETLLTKLDWMPEGDAKTWRQGKGTAFGKDLSSLRKFCEKLMTDPSAKLPTPKAANMDKKAVSPATVAKNAPKGASEAASKDAGKERKAKELVKKAKKNDEKSERQKRHEERVAAKKKETAERKAKEAEAKAARKAERERLKAERDAQPRDPKRMYIAPTQRKRKSPRMSVEDALDAYVIDLVKSRRMLKMKELLAVAAENKITAKGKDNGHVKMNVQNQLRQKFLREEPCFIGGKEFIVSEKELAEYQAFLDSQEEGGDEEQEDVEIEEGGDSEEQDVEEESEEEE